MEPSPHTIDQDENGAYLEDRVEDLAQLGRAAALVDDPLVGRIAHKMRRTEVVLGAERVYYAA